MTRRTKVQDRWRGFLDTSGDGHRSNFISSFSFLVARLGLAPGSPFNREAEAEQAQSTAGPAPDKGLPAAWSKPCFVLRARPSRDETVNSQRTKAHLLNASPELVRPSRETYTTWQYIISQRPEPGWSPLGGVGVPGSGWSLASSGPRGWTLPPWPVTTVCSSEAEGKLGAELSFLSPFLSLASLASLESLAPCWQRNAPSLRLPRVSVLTSDFCLSFFFVTRCYPQTQRDSACLTRQPVTSSSRRTSCPT